MIPALLAAATADPMIRGDMHAWRGQESEAIHSFIPLNGFPLSLSAIRGPDLGGSWHARALMGAREEAKDC